MRSFIRQCLTIAKFDLGTTIRTSRAIVSICLFGVGALISAIVLVKIEEEAREQIQEAKGFLATHQVDLVLEDTLTFFLDGDREMAGHLLHIPLCVSGFFYLSLLFLPYFIALVSHDMINRELINRSARFIIARCKRECMLIGKMLSHLVVLVCITAFANLVLFYYATSKLGSVDYALAVSYLFRFWGFSIIFGFCYLSLTALFSCLIRSRIVSLLLLVVTDMALSILSFSKNIGFISPPYWKHLLWSPRWNDWGLSLLVFFAFGVVFLTLGILRIKRMDI